MTQSAARGGGALLDTARDLAGPQPWRRSLERSLSRRGEPTRLLWQPKHLALALVATASESVAHTLSGGIAPYASAAAPRVPGNPQPAGHPSTGGSAAASIAVRRRRRLGRRRLG